MRDAYLDAAAVALTLVRDPRLSAAWRTPSVLSEFDVAGLAGHLARQVLSVPQLLAAPTGTEAPIALLDHYARSEWVGAGNDADVNVGIRAQGQALAADGPEALAARVAGALSGLEAALATEPADRVVFLPWGPWSLWLDDFLLTRMMEIAVHSDDLACSVATPTPPFPDSVFEPVVALLCALSARRHGQPGLLRALARAERAPRAINAF